ncbi:Non-specific serine/threonine protein kinase [Bertholletia excelsa]
MTRVIAVLIIIFVVIVVVSPRAHVHGLGGSAATFAVVYGSATVCGVVAEQKYQRIACYRNGNVTEVTPETSFDYIAGGRDGFCAVRSGGFSLLCWNSNFVPKRLYKSDTVLLQDLTFGDDQICALTNGSRIRCWRGEWGSAPSPSGSEQFESISSGVGFSCGIQSNTSQIKCWGSNSVIAKRIQNEFLNSSMSSIVVGGSFACGQNLAGFVVCKGRSEQGQLNVPYNSAYEYSGLALGDTHGCATRRSNSTVVCWGGPGDFSSNPTEEFESIVAGVNFTCGLTTANFSILCWGPGWPGDSIELPLPKILPGPCVQSSCSKCGIYPQSQTLCSGSGNICKPCDEAIPTAPPPTAPPPLLPPPISPTPSSPSKALRRGLLAFAIIGSVGAFSGICTIIYCLYAGVCFGKKKVHNSVQPTITHSSSNNGGHVSNSGPLSRSSTVMRRQGSRLMRRQRSGTSAASKHADRAEEFSFPDLAAATDNFSPENKIGSGSFGVVYRGKLWDGREVAVKRSQTQKAKQFQEHESAFESELAFLSRLHHKHLVGLVGYCEDRDERLLVYEYMKNGALHDHLHDKNNVDKSSSVLNSWKMRIKIALDASRGIDYLHDYAVPQIIHRDIKSSNILIDANWTARVSDFGLSLIGSPEGDRGFRPAKAAGTVGYIDPEYYGLNVLTTKSDVYGFGVVLLELLTGKRAIFKDGGENGGAPVSLVDFAVPAIIAGEIGKVLDDRVGQPDAGEAEAVELVANTAVQCVNLEGKDRPSMADIVANLESALALCEESHGSISSGQISIVSE